MKTKILLTILVLGAVLFIDYLILLFIGCTACALSAGNCIHGSVFCKLIALFVIAGTCLPVIIAGIKSLKQNAG